MNRPLAQLQDVFGLFVNQMIWRLTFENETVVSLSGETNADTGAAHPV